MNAMNLFQSVCLLASAALIVLLQTSNNLRFVGWSSRSSFSLRRRHASSLLSSHPAHPTIAPGELPGYTGWARPERTSAGHFRVVGCSSCGSLFSFGGDGIDPNQQTFVAEAGEEFYVDVRCSDPVCSDSGISSEFYLRAYGPSVITGVAHKLDDDNDADGTTYRLSYYPNDAGSYIVEAVVAFTNPPSTLALPLDGNDGKEEPGYEGYLLYDFPLRLEVLPSSAASMDDNNLSLCTTTQLPVYTNSMQDDANILLKGRWVVTETTHESDYTERTSDPLHASLEGYQAAYNAMGIMMEYQPVGCWLVDLCWYDNLDHWFENGQNSNIHLIFVGDSVMGLQHRAVRSVVSGGGRVSATVIGTHGGLTKRLEEVIEELQMIVDENPDERRFVLFNAGLHDIAQLCSVKYKNARNEYLALADGEFSCVELYKTLLSKLTSFLTSYPAELVAFQTTTAGWMPYGNFGFAWNPNEYQPYSLSPNAVAHFNEAAKEVVGEASGGRFLIVDGYYITLARPDHREIGEDNAIGKHMVHPGIEVVDAMARVWLTVVLNILKQ